MAPSYLTWEVERYGPEPPMPVNGEEEGQQCWMKKTEKPHGKVRILAGFGTTLPHSC